MELRLEATRALIQAGTDVVDCPLSQAEQAAPCGEGLGFD